jgi:hypothetical protein
LSASYIALVGYGGFGFVLFLVWAACMEFAIDGDAPRTIRAANILAVIGIVHPAAALAAWDLWRQANRWTDLDGEYKEPPSEAIGVALIVVSTLAAIVVTVLAT